MAISPQQALQDKQVLLQNQIDELEKFFDVNLAAGYNGREVLSIACPETCNEFVARTVLDRFRKAGWEVEVNYNTREGHRAIFKASEKKVLDEIDFSIAPSFEKLITTAKKLKTSANF